MDQNKSETEVEMVTINLGNNTVSNSSETKEDVSQNIAQKQKKPKVSLLSLILILSGSVIGTGIFMSADEIAGSLPSIFYSLLMWLTCGIIGLGAGLCVAELGAKFPSCGGEYIYFLYTYNDWFAFSFMFTNFLFIKPCSVAILVVFFTKTCLVAALPTVGFWGIALWSVVLTWLLCILNCSSDYWSIKVNDILTYSKFCCMGILISLSLYKIFRGEFENIQDWGFSIPVTVGGVSNALYNGMWAYDGFNQLSYMVEDIENPNRDLLVASIVGLGIVIVFYAIVNLSYIIILGIKQVSVSGNAAVLSAQAFMGKWSLIVVILIALSAFGSANTTAFCGVRIYCDAARNGHLPRIIAGVHKTKHTMIPALFLQALITSFFLICVRDISTLLLYFSGASWVYYTATILAVIILRYRSPSDVKTFRVPIFLAVILTLVSFAIVVLGFFQNWLQSLISVSLIFVSIPVYYLFIKRRNSFPMRYKYLIDNFTEKLLDFLECDISESYIPNCDGN